MIHTSTGRYNREGSVKKSVNKSIRQEYSMYYDNNLSNSMENSKEINKSYAEIILNNERNERRSKMTITNVCDIEERKSPSPVKRTVEMTISTISVETPPKISKSIIYLISHRSRRRKIKETERYSRD